MRRKVASFLCLALLVLTGSTAFAAPRDKAAQKKIEEAMYTNFLNTDFDAAEGLLLGTIRACEDKCSPAIIAKVWMYIGIVRGSGRNDLPGAAEAFATAVATDPAVALDNEIATDPVKAAFAKAKAGGGSAPGETGTAPGPAAAGGGAAPFTCTPSPTEVETRRPVPMQCETDKDLATAKLYYKSFSGGWSNVKMEQHEGTWRGTIPCSATQNTGKLRFYAEGLDADGEVAASLGAKDKPQAVDVVSETSADPPAFPEEEPPARCSISEGGETPPPAAGGGACGSWGAPCGADNCCEAGLSCNAGVCEGKCESDADCKNGATCTDGKCEGGTGPEGDGKGGAGATNWLGLHVGMDIASISSDKACDPSSRNDFIHCFQGGDPYQNTPSAAAAGKISGGFTLATVRALASYEHLFGAFGVEARLGFAFNGGQTFPGGSAFLPVHAEARAKYWVLGESSLSKPGLRPWIHLGGGMAEIDATISAQIYDCGKASTAPAYDACVKATTVEAAKNTKIGRVITVDATKQLGFGFVTVGGGLMYAVAKNHGPVLNVSFIIPLPSTGFVIEPTIGYAYGF